MKKYIGFITASTKDEYLWTGGTHYEDWLGLDAPVGSYKGSSRADFIASAFYAPLHRAGGKGRKGSGEDVSEYEALYDNIVKTFRRTFPDYRTQTEMVLAVHFDLAEDKQKTADQLAAKVTADGKKLQTGFVGTPYLLHVLSSWGHTDLAYTLLLRTEYPSWLYPVTKGATTVWEHWDGIMENGDFWSVDMNSFNHYATARWQTGSTRKLRESNRRSPDSRRCASRRSRTDGWNGWRFLWKPDTAWSVPPGAISKKTDRKRYAMRSSPRLLP